MSRSCPLVVKFNRDQFERQGDNMCKVIKKIYGKSANEILNLYGQGDSVPVDLSKLLLRIGISALPYDFTELEKEAGCKQGDISGFLLTKEDKAAIFFRAADSVNRQRFTIAHELAHCCLHIKDYDRPHIEFRLADEEKDRKEKDADIFAGELLIPLKRLRKVYTDLTVPTSSALASSYVVSISVMEARLDYLKISYYNQDGQAVIYGNDE